MADAPPVHVTINGIAHTLPAAATVRDAVAALGLDPAVPGVAAAVGDEIVPRRLWAERPLRGGDRVEVVTAAQGG